MKDKELLDHYTKVAEVLAEMFSPVLEVVVFDYRKHKKAIIAIFNSHVTGREIGDPLTQIGEKRIHGDEVPDVIVNYPNNSPKGQKLKSSSIAIRNEEQKMIGAIGFNLDISHFEKFSMFLETFCSTDKNVFQIEKGEYASKTPKEEISEAIDSFLIQKGWQSSNLSSGDKREVVKFLKQNNYFNQRASVTIVANQLKITRPSVYKYIKEAD